MLSHPRLHVAPGGKHPLTPDALHLIHDTVENPHTHIGHTDLIGIREAEGHSDIHFPFVLFHLSPLTANISGRLLHLGQDSVFDIGHRETP